ncbi:transmembrane protein, putative [Medicago truncatula]|uniref:Transmembrane protein, putative n=1 Tax=Medicago truncatula TaxID=3880 RepID=A0A072URG0_MEDTR|nr:transmembrane protein, putative [Medicago truncatula]
MDNHLAVFLMLLVLVLLPFGTENLMQDVQVHLITLENTPKVITEKNMHLEEPKPRINERMDLELNDYAPSGANGRHTPRAP